MPIDPPFGINVSEFVSPSILDKLVYVDCDSRVGNYAPIAVGTAHPDSTNYPGYVLIHQLPLNKDQKIVRRFYAAARVNQDLYNFSISYPYGDENYPRYTREYIIPRADYAPVAGMTADPLIAGLFLVDQKHGRSGDREWDNYFVLVQRSYEKVPGVIITSENYNQRGDYVTKTQQLVEEGTDPDADGLLVISSSVDAINTIVATKTKEVVSSYATLGGKGIDSGLLGYTTITKDIVAAGTAADALELPNGVAARVIKSDVTPLSATKSERVTIRSTGPISLGGKENSSGLLGKTNTNETIVAAGSDASDLEMPDGSTTKIIKSTVEPIDEVKSKRTNVLSTGPIVLGGAQNKDGLLGLTTTSETIVAAGASATALSTTVLQSQVDPIDEVKSKRTTVTASGPTSLAGEANKPGLLGLTTTTDEIVAAGADPTALSTTVLQSVVEPIDAAKSKRSTVVASGPTSLQGEANKAGLLGLTTTTEEIVAAGADPTALSTSVLQSVVEPIDSAKSQKTTIVASGPTSLTGAGADSGLLGLTVEYQSIVSAGAAADSLEMPDGAERVIKSIVSPIDSAKSQKTTIKATGPITLSGAEVDSGLLGYTTQVVTIVAAGAAAEALEMPDGTAKIIKSTVEPIDSVKSKRTTIKSTGPITLGGKRIDERGSTVGIVETIVAAGASPEADSLLQVGSVIEPIDAVKSKRTTSTVDTAHKTLTSELRDERGDKLTVVSTIVDPASAEPETLSVTVTDSQVKAISLTKAEKTVSTSNGPSTLTAKRINELGILETTTDDIVAPGATAPAGGYLITKDTLEPMNIGRARRLTSTVASWPTMLDYEVDEDLRLLVTITRQFINISGGPSAPTITAGEEVTQRSLDINKALRTTKSIVTADLPTETLYQWIDYQFPSLLLDITLETQENLAGTDSRQNINYNIRRGWREKTRAKFIIDYQTTEFTASESLYQIKPVDLLHDGFLFNINCDNVLTDADELIATNGTNDPTWPYTEEHFIIEESTPSMSAYVDAIGDEVLVSEIIEQWRYNLWRRVQVYVTLQ